MSPRKDVGLLVLRLAVGGTLIAHGSQKLFGLLGGDGLEGTAKTMDALGFRPGMPSAVATGLGLTGGGASLVLGLATPAGGAVAAATMATAASVHAPKGFFAIKGGLEHPAMLSMASAALAIAGPGRFSLDHLARHTLNRSWMPAVALAATAAGAGVVLARRKRALKSDER